MNYRGDGKTMKKK